MRVCVKTVNFMNLLVFHFFPDFDREMPTRSGDWKIRLQSSKALTKNMH